MDKRIQTNKKVSPDEWYTPRELLMKLGHFDCDPCAAPADVRPYQTAPVCWTKDDDGLHKWWHGVVWLNPPYSKPLLRQFVEKLARHGNGMALLVNRTDNLLFQEVVFPYAKSMLFMRHRVKFLTADGKPNSPMFGSVLVAFGDECDKRLRNCGIEGKYVVLNV